MALAEAVAIVYVWSFIKCFCLWTWMFLESELIRLWLPHVVHANVDVCPNSIPKSESTSRRNHAFRCWVRDPLGKCNTPSRVLLRWVEAELKARYGNRDIGCCPKCSCRLVPKYIARRTLEPVAQFSPNLN